MIGDAVSEDAGRIPFRGNDLPLLSEPRDAFNSDEFRLLRNPFGHWSFEWHESVPVAAIGVVDWETGKQTVSLSLLECLLDHSGSIGDPFERSAPLSSRTRTADAEIKLEAGKEVLPEELQEDSTGRNTTLGLS